MRINVGEALEAKKNERSEKLWKNTFTNPSANVNERYEKALAAYTAALAPIDEIISKIEGRAKARTIKAADILWIIERVDDGLKIPKSHMKGVTISADPNAQTFPRSYKYTPESTQFTATHNGKEWVVTEIWRGECRRPSNEIQVTLTDDAKEAVIKSIVTGSRF